MTAEEAADRAVETAATADTLRESLRETPGAHKDFLYAIETRTLTLPTKPTTICPRCWNKQTSASKRTSKPSTRTHH